MPITVLPGIGRHARDDRAHVAGDVFGQPDDAAGLDAGRGFELVHRHHRAGAHGGDLALDVEIVEHVFEQAGVAFQRQLVELARLVLRRLGQQIEARAGRTWRTCRAAWPWSERSRGAGGGGVGDLGRTARGRGAFGLLLDAARRAPASQTRRRVNERGSDSSFAPMTHAGNSGRVRNCAQSIANTRVTSDETRR